MTLNVLVVQPTIPHYRTAFFKGIAQRLNGSLQIQASAKIPGGPDSVPSSELAGVACSLNHGLLAFRHNMLYWQRGLSLKGLHKGDVLFVAGNPRFLSIFPLILRAKAKGVGVIIQGHGWSSSSGALSARIRHALWRLGDVVFLYTDEERAQFIANGFDPTRVFAANNTIGTDDIKQAQSEWPTSRLTQFQSEQGLHAEAPLLLFCGRLTEKAELHLLIQSLVRVRQTNGLVRLAIVGQGQLEAELREQVRALGLDDAVIWLGEIHDEAQLAPWFLSASLFVYPGAIGLSLLHAFNYGLPVVTHDQMRQHNPEIAALTPGVNGAVYPQGDADALAACLLTLLSSPETIRAMKTAALATVQDRFSTDMMVNRFIEAVQTAHELTRAA